MDALLKRVVSGGQTGADRAGLDVAIRYFRMEAGVPRAGRPRTGR